ncbi:MAG: hypothetical protein Q9167_001428 [Letrouitia subvulpina]
MVLRPLYAIAAPSGQVSPRNISFITEFLTAEQKSESSKPISCGSGVSVALSDHRPLWVTDAQFRDGATAALAKTVELYRLYGAQGWTISLAVHGAIWLLLIIRIEAGIETIPPALISRKPTWPNDPVQFPVVFRNGIAVFFVRGHTGNRQQTNILVQGLKGYLQEIETAAVIPLPYRTDRRWRLGVRFSLTSLFVGGATLRDYKDGAVAFLKKIIELYETYGAQSWHIRLVTGRQVWFMVGVALGVPKTNPTADQHGVDKPVWPGTDIYFTLASVPSVQRARLHFFHNLSSGTQTQLEALLARLREYLIELAMAEQPPTMFQKTKDCGHGVLFDLRDQYPVGVIAQRQKIGLMAMVREVIQLYERYGAQSWGIMLQVNYQNWYLLTVVMHRMSPSRLTSRQEKCDREKSDGILNISIEEQAQKFTKPTWPGRELVYPLQGIPGTSNAVAHFFWPGRDGGKHQLDAFQQCMRLILSDVVSRRASERFQIVKDCGSSVRVTMYDWLMPIPFAHKQAGVIALIRKITALYEDYGAQQWHISLDIPGSRWITVFVTVGRERVDTGGSIVDRGLDKPTVFGGLHEDCNFSKPTWPRHPAFKVRGYPESALLFSAPGREGNKDQLEAFATGVSSFLHMLRSDPPSILTTSKDCGRGVSYVFKERDMYLTRQQTTLAAIAMLQQVIALYSQYGVKGWKIWMIVGHVLRFSMEVTVRPLTLGDRDVAKPTWPGSEFPVESIPGAQLLFSNPQRTGNSAQNGALIACMKSFIFHLSERSSPDLNKMMRCRFGTNFSFDDLRPVRETYEEKRMAAVAMLKTLVMLYEWYGAQSWDVRLRLHGKMWFLLLISFEAYPVVMLLDRG